MQTELAPPHDSAWALFFYESSLSSDRRVFEACKKKCGVKVSWTAFDMAFSVCERARVDEFPTVVFFNCGRECGSRLVGQSQVTVEAVESQFRALDDRADVSADGTITVVRRRAVSESAVGPFVSPRIATPPRPPPKKRQRHKADEPRPEPPSKRAKTDDKSPSGENMFDGVVFYFATTVGGWNRRQCMMLMTKVRALGGTIENSPSSSTVTHVIVGADKVTTDRERGELKAFEQAGATVLCKQWIGECIRNNTLVDEAEFRVSSSPAAKPQLKQQQQDNIRFEQESPPPPPPPPHHQQQQQEEQEDDDEYSVDADDDGKAQDLQRALTGPPPSSSSSSAPRLPGRSGWASRSKNRLTCQIGAVGPEAARFSPNLNRKITDVLQEVEAYYTWCGEKKKYQVRGYQTVRSMLENYTKLETRQDVEAFCRLPRVGDKMRKKLLEIVTTGALRQLQTIRADPAFRATQEFAKIHGVGAMKSVDWYRRGWRTLEDVRKNEDQLTPAQRIGLKHVDEFQERIPRAEVGRIERIVVDAAKKLHAGAGGMAVGSYRRGKASSGDADILLTVRDHRAWCNELESFTLVLIATLKEMGFITDSLSSPRTSDKKGTFMGVCLVPKGCPEYSGVHRRLDIKVYPAGTFPYALLYFTGSDHFNRSMRWYAKTQGWTLSDNGLARAVRDRAGDRIAQGEVVHVTEERQIFAVMGLTYVEPHLRNTKDEWRQMIDVQDPDMIDDDSDE